MRASLFISCSPVWTLDLPGMKLLESDSLPLPPSPVTLWDANQHGGGPFLARSCFFFALLSPLLTFLSFRPGADGAHAQPFLAFFPFEDRESRGSTNPISSGAPPTFPSVGFCRAFCYPPFDQTPPPHGSVFATRSIASSDPRGHKIHPPFQKEFRDFLTATANGTEPPLCDPVTSQPACWLTHSSSSVELLRPSRF